MEENRMIPLQTFGTGMVGLAVILALLMVLLAFLNSLASQASPGTPTRGGRREALSGIVGLVLIVFVIGAAASQAVERLFSADAELANILTIGEGETHTIDENDEEEYGGVDIHETGMLVLQSGATLTINR